MYQPAWCEGDGVLAIWRRFEEVLFPTPPTDAKLCRLLGVKLRGVRYDFDPKEIVERGCFKGDSHADVERVVRRAVKEMVLQGNDMRLCLKHLEKAMRREAGKRLSLQFFAKPSRSKARAGVPLRPRAVRKA